MANIIKESGFNAIDKINMISIPMDIKKKVNEQLVVVGACIYEKPDKETGEVVRVGAVRTVDGDIYGFTSGTLQDCTDALIDIFDDGATSITIQPISGQSNAGRTFYQFKVLAVD